MNRIRRIASALYLALTLAAGALLLLPLILESSPWPRIAADYLQESAIEDTGARNTVSAIYLGYRVFDTLGETIVLLVAVSGTIGIIAQAGAALARGYENLDAQGSAAGRNHSGAEESKATGISVGMGSRAPSFPEADAKPKIQPVHRRLRTVLLEVVTGKLGPVVLVFGIYVMLYGHLSPGGGFQGGVVIASGIVFLALGGRKGASTRLTEPTVLAALEGAGFLLLVLAGLAGIVTGGGFFANVLELAGLPSVAFIILLNAVIGIKVGAGIGFMCIAMLGRVDH